ncbi:MAG: divalent metal cation transporter [Methylococcaceae bacterium]
MTFKSRILNILFWSVISAAFIGPGTVTTAAKAGASFQFDLLWALVFSTIACLVLQEASARIAILSNYNLGQAIAYRYHDKSIRLLILGLVVGAIILGAAAYQTGNILGAVAGISLISSASQPLVILILAGIAALVLSLPSLQNLARFTGIIVVFMGVAFFTAAILLKPDFAAILKGSFIPIMPSGIESGLLVLGLVGTTVVPYNLFLGSGISDKNQSIQEMRFGLSIAVILGGVISMAVLVVGSIVQGEFSFQALAEILNNKIGSWATYLLALGLFAAGFSSLITAPLASAITAQGLFGDHQQPEKWAVNSRNFRLVWSFVLVSGVSFGLAGFKPIPAIIAAQALNGLLLPFVSVFLLLVTNDPKLMGKNNINGIVSNGLLGIVVWISFMLGLINVFKAAGSMLKLDPFASNNGLFLIIVVSGLIMFWVARATYRTRQQ